MIDRPPSGYRYAGPDHFAGLPARDLRPGEYEALSPRMQRVVRESGAYEAFYLDDPLGEMKDRQYARLKPARKSARTREANKLVRADAGTTVPDGETTVVPEDTDFSGATITAITAGDGSGTGDE